MSNPAIKNLIYKEQDIGKTIKSTKKLFTWEFCLDDKPQKIELYDSKLSDKRKLVKNGQVIEVVKNVIFVKTFEINGHSITIIQHGEKYELRIDNQSFGHMMDLERNRNFFGGNQPGSTSNVSTNNFKLNMGAKPTNYGTGIMNNNKDNKPTLFNFAIKPANQINPNFSNRKFGGETQTESMTINKPSNSNNINNIVDQLNSGNNNNLLDLGELTSTTIPQNNNSDNLFNIDFTQKNILNNNENTNTIQSNNNNNVIDPFDIINSISTNNNSNLNNIPNNAINQNYLMGLNANNQSANSDKAQNLLNAMFDGNNGNGNFGNNGNFVDLSKQNIGGVNGIGNMDNNFNMNLNYNQNYGMNHLIQQNDMTYNNMNMGYAVNSNMSYNNMNNQNVGQQFNNMNNNFNYGGNNQNSVNYGYSANVPNHNQNMNNKKEKDLLDDLF